MTSEERAQQTLKMEELEAERDLVEAIRAGVAAAAKVINDKGARNIRNGGLSRSSSCRCGTNRVWQDHSICSFEHCCIASMPNKSCFHASPLAELVLCFVLLIVFRGHFVLEI